MKISKLLMLGVVLASIFVSCASTKVTSQAKTPNSIDADSSVSVEEAR